MQCRLIKPMYLKALLSELRILLMFLLLQQNFLLSASFLSSEANLASSTNIELLTAPCNVDQID